MFWQYESLRRNSSIPFSVRHKSLKLIHDSKSVILLSWICFYHVSDMFVLLFVWPTCKSRRCLRLEKKAEVGVATVDSVDTK